MMTTTTANAEQLAWMAEHAPRIAPPPGWRLAPECIQDVARADLENEIVVGWSILAADGTERHAAKELPDNVEVPEVMALAAKDPLARVIELWRALPDTPETPVGVVWAAVRLD